MSCFVLFDFEEDFFFLFANPFRSPGNVVTFYSKLEPVSFALFRAACLRFFPFRTSETKLVPLFKTSLPINLAPFLTSCKTDHPIEAKILPIPYSFWYGTPEK